MPSDFTEKQLTSKTVYQGKLLHVKEDTVQLPNGNTARREYIAHPGAVVMIPLFPDGSVLLERQFRYPVGQHFIELPAGKIDAGEEPLATAKRELLEETGYKAESWDYLTTIHPCVGYANEAMALYLVRKLTYQAQQLDQDEFLETFRLPLDEALRWVREGKITEVKAIIGLFWAEKHLHDIWV